MKKESMKKILNYLNSYGTYKLTNTALLDAYYKTTIESFNINQDTSSLSDSTIGKILEIENYQGMYKTISTDKRLKFSTAKRVMLQKHDKRFNELIRDMYFRNRRQHHILREIILKCKIFNREKIMQILGDKFTDDEINLLSSDVDKAYNEIMTAENLEKKMNDKKLDVCFNDKVVCVDKYKYHINASTLQDIKSSASTLKDIENTLYDNEVYINCLESNMACNNMSSQMESRMQENVTAENICSVIVEDKKTITNSKKRKCKNKNEAEKKQDNKQLSQKVVNNMNNKIMVASEKHLEGESALTRTRTARKRLTRAQKAAEKRVFNKVKKPEETTCETATVNKSNRKSENTSVKKPEKSTCETATVNKSNRKSGNTPGKKSLTKSRKVSLRSQEINKQQETKMLSVPEIQKEDSKKVNISTGENDTSLISVINNSKNEKQAHLGKESFNNKAQESHKTQLINQNLFDTTSQDDVFTISKNTRSTRRQRIYPIRSDDILSETCQQKCVPSKSSLDVDFYPFDRTNKRKINKHEIRNSGDDWKNIVGLGIPNECNNTFPFIYDGVVEKTKPKTVSENHNKKWKPTDKVLKLTNTKTSKVGKGNAKLSYDPNSKAEITYDPSSKSEISYDPNSKAEITYDFNSSSTRHFDGNKNIQQTNFIDILKKSRVKKDSI